MHEMQISYIRIVDLLSGKRNGKGILYYDAMGTSYYDGQWKDNQKEGTGTRRFVYNVEVGWFDHTGEANLKFDVRSL